MKNFTFQVLSLSLMFVSASAWAQLDSSLLHPTGYSPSPQSLDSSRYNVHTPEKTKSNDDDDESPGTFIASPVPKNTSTSAKVSTSSPVHVETTAPPTVAPGVPAAPAQPPPPPAADPTAEPAHPPVTMQVKQLILGGDDDIDDAKKQIHPEDPRANIVSISLAPAYFYQSSSSNYSYHNYQTNGPGFGLGMNLWFTPFFGLQSNYMTSVSGSVRDGADMVPMSVQDFSAGIRFRRHFGYSRKSAQISWGIDYHDYSNKISYDSGSNVGSDVSGLSLAVEGTLPSSNTYAHIFEVAVRPFQHHSELGTSVSVQSGGSCESNALSLSLGGQWNLDRRNQVYWKAQYSVERDLYTGTASTPDERTGITPSGVGVTNSLAIFYFGFKWGS